MRPEKAYRKISKVLWNDFLVCGQLKTLSMYEIIQVLKKIEPELKKIYEKSLLRDGDYTSGVESYGYDGEDSIKINLNYISDRWNCSFRIRWLLDLIKLDVRSPADQAKKENKYDEG